MSNMISALSSKEKDNNHNSGDNDTVPYNRRDTCDDDNLDSNKG